MIDAYTPARSGDWACSMFRAPWSACLNEKFSHHLEVGGWIAICQNYAKLGCWKYEKNKKMPPESDAFLFLWITQRGCKVASYKPEASRHHLSSSSPSTNSSSWLKETWQWNGSEKIYFLKVSNVHECCIIYLEGQSESFDTPPGMHATPGRKKASVVQRRKHPRASIIDARWVLVPCVASKNDFAWAQAEKDWKSESISVVKESRHSMGFAWP